MTARVEIHDQQATPRGLLLQRAADGSHVVSHRIEVFRLTGSLLFGCAAVVATLWPAVAPAIAVAGAVWALLSFGVLAPWSQRETTGAALAQELFDTWLFRIPWSTSIIDPRPADEDLRRCARRSTLGEARMATWYPDVSGIEHEYGTLICQRENLSWDARLRSRWASVLSCGVAAWTVVGICVGLGADLSVRELLVRWFVPSMSALLLAEQHARANRELSRERALLGTRVRGLLDAADSAPLSDEDRQRLRTESRSIQDGIFRTRKRSERVPRWLYERFRTNDEADMRETAAETVGRLSLG